MDTTIVGVDDGNFEGLKNDGAEVAGRRNAEYIERVELNTIHIHVDDKQHRNNAVIDMTIF